MLSKCLLPIGNMVKQSLSLPLYTVTVEPGLLTENWNSARGKGLVAILIRSRHVQTRSEGTSQLS